jgi:plastocyanin
LAILLSPGAVLIKGYAQTMTSNATNPSTAAVSVHSDVDSTPIAVVIIINRDQQGTSVFVPNNITIKAGEELLILNNDTIVHSFTNGMGKDDPMTGKLFDTGQIQPKGFTEYVASNLSPGNYTFHSTTNPNMIGHMMVTDNK